MTNKEKAQKRAEIVEFCKTHRDWTYAEIADHFNYSHPFVANLARKAGILRCPNLSLAHEKAKEMLAQAKAMAAAMPIPTND